MTTMRFLILLALTLTTAVAAYDPTKMLCLVNTERVKHGLPALGMDARLQSVAQQHSNDQAHMNSMGHSGSNGSSPTQRIFRTSHTWNTCAENVAFSCRSEEGCMNTWMDSPGHRENILNPEYTHFGSSVAYRGSAGYYTQDFGGDGHRHNFPVCPGGRNFIHRGPPRRVVVRRPPRHRVIVRRPPRHRIVVRRPAPRRRIIRHTVVHRH